MQPTEDNSRRKTLRFITQVMFLVGFVIVAIPFFSGETKVNSDTFDVNVSHLKPGESMRIVWGTRPVFILKRSEDMLVLLRKPDDRLLDPWSKNSRQPEASSNVYRSVSPGYFVSFLGCGDHGYPVVHRPSDLFEEGGHGGLVCTVGTGVYDYAGRAYAGFSDQSNLSVPAYSFIEDDVIRLGEE